MIFQIKLGDYIRFSRLVVNPVTISRVSYDSIKILFNIRVKLIHIYPDRPFCKWIFMSAIPGIRMNGTDSNSGGFKNSIMYKWLNSTFRDGISNMLGFTPIKVSIPSLDDEIINIKKTYWLSTPYRNKTDFYIVDEGKLSKSNASNLNAIIPVLYF